jgi:acyl-CoA synthetase (AMP-forming)/AMP-acid ligase II
MLTFAQELIKVRGFQVAPAELEGHLLDHPDVSDACVVGIPHEYSGEVPLAFVVISSGSSSKAGQELKKAIMKVGTNIARGYSVLTLLLSMLLMRRCNTNTCTMWSLSPRFRRILRANCFVASFVIRRDRRGLRPTIRKLSFELVAHDHVL